MIDPAFSIIIPTYQRRDMVCDVVRALGGTRYGGSVEIIVVVDGSTDGTAATLRKLECRLPLQIIEQPNSGAATARNRGAEAASGDIFLFLDDDMIAEPDLLTEHARTHENGADAVVGHIPLDPRSPAGVLRDGVREWAEQRANRLRTSQKVGFFDVLTGHLSVKRSIFAELRGFDTDFTHNGSFGNEDLDFGVRLLAVHRVEFNPNAISHQRYCVSARRYLDQWRDAGRADVLFARKHPTRAKELFELRGTQAPRHRFVLRPASRVPGVRALLSSLAVTLAQPASDLPRPVQRPVRQLIRATRDLFYWAGVHSEAKRR